jgi:nucleobase:cation symporter-1, NCS1 family
VIVQLPFISSAFYTGPLVDSLDGADISWIVGLIVPAVLYLFAARRTVHRIPAQLILPADATLVTERVSQ